jgi:hypothetical protein
LKIFILIPEEKPVIKKAKKKKKNCYMIITPEVNIWLTTMSKPATAKFRRTYECAYQNFSLLKEKCDSKQETLA